MSGISKSSTSGTRPVSASLRTEAVPTARFSHMVRQIFQRVVVEIDVSFLRKLRFTDASTVITESQQQPAYRGSAALPSQTFRDRGRPRSRKDHGYATARKEPRLVEPAGILIVLFPQSSVRFTSPVRSSDPRIAGTSSTERSVAFPGSEPRVAPYLHRSGLMITRVSSLSRTTPRSAALPDPVRTTIRSSRKNPCIAGFCDPARGHAISPPWGTKRAVARHLRPPRATRSLQWRNPHLPPQPCPRLAGTPSPQ